MSASAKLDAFIRRIPKTETHLHLEGALPYAALRALDADRFPENPSFRSLDYRYPSFVEFETLLIEHAMAWFNSAERYHEAAKLVFEELRSQNVRYVETSFHLHMVEFIGVSEKEILAAIKAAAPDDLEVRVIGGMVRNGYSDTMKPIIDGLHAWDELDGIDLHGQEWHDLEAWTAPVWQRCREAGKIVKVHAGEFGGPEKVREALDVLGSRRIQHGVRSVEDAELVKRLAAEGAVLDVCPLSNTKLQVVESLEAHPLRQLVDAGITCTLNTDDPLCFANRLEDEYRAAATTLGFSIDELAQFAKNGFEHSQLERSHKDRFIREIDEAAAI